MREIKFRACISPKTIIFFTLQDLVDPMPYEAVGNIYENKELLTNGC